MYCITLSKSVHPAPRRRVSASLSLSLSLSLRESIERSHRTRLEVHFSLEGRGYALHTMNQVIAILLACVLVAAVQFVSAGTSISVRIINKIKLFLFLFSFFFFSFSFFSLCVYVRQ